MGYVSSKIKKINDVRFEPIPSGKQIKGVVACTRVDEWLFFLRKNGVVYTEHEICRKAVFCDTGSDYAPIKAMIVFGLVTKGEAQEHGEKKRAYDLNRERYFAASYELAHLHAIGIKLTKRQCEKLVIAAKLVDIDNLPHYIPRTIAKAKLGRK